MISAGFDAMAGDPLGGFTLEPEHYADLTRRLRDRLPRRPSSACSRAATPHPASPMAPWPTSARCSGRTSTLEDLVSNSSAWKSSCSSSGPGIRSSSRAASRAITAPCGCGSRTPTATRAGARRRRRSSTARPPRRSSPRSTPTARDLPDDPFDLEEAERRWEQLLRRNPAARAALSSALHDLVGKRLGVPVYRLWGLDPAKAPRSTFTIGLDTPEKMRAKVREAEQYPILKIKLGTDRDVEILRTIRDATDREIRVDANCGWTLKQAVAHAAGARGVRGDRAGAAAPPDQLDGLAEIRRRADIPVIADESCVTAADIPPLVGKVDGINIKLAKCGSLREALRMIASPGRTG